MLVDIDCLSLVPSFTPSLNNDPFFFYICKEFDKNFKSLARFARIWITGILKNSVAIFHQNLQMVT